jgi:plastocyanin
MRLLQAALWTMAAGALIAVPAAARTAPETVAQTANDAVASATVTAADPGSSGAASAQIVGLDSALVFSTESAPWEVLFGTATTAKAVVILDAPCAKYQGGEADADGSANGFAVYGVWADGRFLEPAEGRELTPSMPDNVGAGRRENQINSGKDLVVDQPVWPLDDAGSGGNTGPCVLKLQAMIGSNDPASGWLSLGNDSRVAFEAGGLVPYRVTRGSSWVTFAIVTVFAVIAGLVGVYRFTRSEQLKPAFGGGFSWSGLTSNWTQSFYAPKDHPLRGSWVSTAAAVGAVATTLLAATGALGELVPQYQTGKVVIGNILVLAALALAAALVAAGINGQQLTLKYAAPAVFVAVSAVAAQLLLAGLVLMHASTHWPVQSLVVVAAIGVAFIVAISSKAAGRLPGPLGPPAPGSEGEQDTPPSQAIPDADEITIEMTEMAFDPATIEVTAGESVNLVVTNRGEVFHDLTIDALDLQIGVDPGQTATAGLEVDEPGEYEYHCSVPGHTEAGMQGTLTVLEPRD